MDLEKGQVLIDFDFQANLSFIDTPEFLVVVMLKEALDYMVSNKEITAAVIEIAKQKPLWVEVRRSLPGTDTPMSHIVNIGMITKDFKNKLGKEAQLVFLKENL